MVFYNASDKVFKSIEIDNLEDPKILNYIEEHELNSLKESIELIDGVYPAFDQKKYLNSEITPVFFGSAVNNFGVKELLDCFVEVAPSPLPRDTSKGIIDPLKDEFSGFVFKIHANIDPKHRDRIAFLRICSGRFERNKRYLHSSTGKLYKASNPTAFMAQKKEIIDYAYPGDIIGLHDTGNLKIGDSLSDIKDLHFKGIPSFSPEMFKLLVNLDPLKSKQLSKGIEHLTEEGVAQFFVRYNSQDKIIGTVGALQFEVIQYRLEHEYKAKSRFDNLSFFKACWIKSENESIFNEFVRSRQSQIALDKDGNYVYLAETRWSLDREISENPEINFYFTSEFKT